jgi:hypothetical protein
MEQSIKHKRIVQILFWTAAISSWLTFIFFFTIPFGLLFWLGVLVYLFIKRTKLKWYLLLCSSWTVVPLVSFVSGTKDYFQGKAAIETFGMPDAEFYNLDPNLRLWKSTSGCIVIGFEPFTQVPNNLAVKLWTKMLGTQSGVYNGIYPTKEQAEEMIKHGEQMNLFEVADTIILNNNKQNLFLTTSNHSDLAELEKSNSAKAFILDNECLLIEPNGDTTKSVIILADKNKGSVFARYYNYQAR